MATASAVEQLIGQEPEELEQEAPAHDYGEDNRDLPDDLKLQIRNLLSHYQTLEQYPRRTEVQSARLKRFYWRNDQYIYWNSRDFIYSTTPQAGLGATNGDQSVQMPRYTDVYNIFTPYGRAIIAVLTQNLVGVDFEPLDSGNPDDIQASNLAEKYKNKIDRDNQMKSLQQDIARLFWTDGRVVLYQHRVKDGVDSNGKPKYKQKIEAKGVLESKVPITANTRAEMNYAILADELDYYSAKHKYKWAADDIQEGGSQVGESDYERFARLGVLQGTGLLMQAGDAYAHMATRQRAFFRPEAFEYLPEEYRDQMLEIFPDGCECLFVGGGYCGSWNESMDAHISIRFPLPGDGMNRSASGDIMVPVQNTFNDLMNMYKEFLDYCTPNTYFDDRLIDADGIPEWISQPGNRRPVDLAGSNLQSLSDGFYTETPGQVPEQLILMVEKLQGEFSQLITAAVPALFGGTMESNETASGYAMARDQAMGQLGPSWGAMQELYAETYQQAIEEEVKYSDPADTVNVTIARRGRTVLEKISMADLKKGNFRCVPDSDSSLPQTTGAKRQIWQALVAASAGNPALAEIANDPRNQEMAQEWSGIPEAIIPAAAAGDKQLREIDELLKSEPQEPTQEEIEGIIGQASLQNQMLQTQGQPIQPVPTPEELTEKMTKSSVPIDPVMDRNQYHFQVVQDYLESAEAEEEAKLNPKGVENVRLHGMEHWNAMQSSQGGPPKKPPGVSVNYKDVSDPDEQQQILAAAGITKGGQ